MGGDQVEVPLRGSMPGHGDSLAMPLGARRVVAHPDGESVVYLSLFGEVGGRRISTGELLWRASIERNAGARFSRRSGLSDETLDALELAGAVIGE